MVWWLGGEGGLEAEAEGEEVGVVREVESAARSPFFLFFLVDGEKKTTLLLSPSPSLLSFSPSGCSAREGELLARPRSRTRCLMGVLREKEGGWSEGFSRSSSMVCCLSKKGLPFYHLLFFKPYRSPRGTRGCPIRCPTRPWACAWTWRRVVERQRKAGKEKEVERKMLLKKEKKIPL